MTTQNCTPANCPYLVSLRPPSPAEMERRSLAVRRVLEEELAAQKARQSSSLMTAMRRSASRMTLSSVRSWASRVFRWLRP